MISIGVDIGEFSIKLAEVEATSKSYVIRNVRELALSPDTTRDKKIEIIDHLRTLFSRCNPDQTQFIFALPQKHVSVRLLRLPFKERFKVQKAIVSQLDDELPFAVEDAIFDAKIVRYVGRAADVLAMAVPHERVAEIYDLAKDCGVNPQFISTEGAALNNLFERWWEAPPEGFDADVETRVVKPAEVVVNIGHASTDLLVYVDGYLNAIRHMDWGAKNIAEQIAQKYGLNNLLALRELQTKGFIMLDKAQGTREQAAFSDCIEKALEGLVHDMRLKLLELQSEMHLQWTKGQIVGGGSQLKNLTAYLTQQFEIPFNRYLQFEKHPAVTFETTSHLDLVSPVAVGLALEGLRRPRNPATNFLKGDLAQQGSLFETLTEKWGFAARIAGAAFVILLVFSLIREQLAFTLMEESDRALKTQAQAVAGLKGAQASARGIRSFISSQEEMEKNRQAAERVVSLNSALDVLNAISANIPGNDSMPLEIKRLSISNDTAEIHGYAVSASARDQVLTALRRIAVGTVQSTDSRVNTPAGRVGFAYRFKVNRFGG